MSDIFLSHAVADKPLVDLFVRFLKEAIGVPTKEIFCSSIPGHGVPLTKDFNAYMKDKIQNPKLVFLFMTPAYMESAFCLMELGAAWAKSLKTLPIVVPPTSFSEVTKTLGLIQAWNIEKHSGLIDLRAAVKATGIKLEERNEHDWESKRNEWRTKSKKVTRKLNGRTSVPESEHQAALGKIANQDKEIAHLESQLNTASETIEKLKKAKDTAAVKAIMKDTGGSQALDEEFDSLIANVKDALPSVSSIVKLHLIMDHYDKASRIDWFHDRTDFEDAIQRNLINNDEGNSVAWGRPKLSKLRKALQSLDHFLDSDDGKDYMATREDDVAIEADDLDFWRQYI